MIYLDNNATTQVAPEVFAAMEPFLKHSYGNPSSAHALGQPMRKALETARNQIAELLGANDSREIVFTSCGSESDNWAIGGYLEQNPNRRHIITTRVEHEAVRNLCEHLAEIGYEVTWLEVDQNGELDFDDLRRALRRDTGLVSVMLANNETGVLFPIEEIGSIVRENSELPPFIIGGGQERGRRSGTEAVPNIVALGRACELAKQFTGHEQIKALRDRLEDQILATFPDARLNGTADRSKRLPNTTNISFTGWEGPEILKQLSDAGICVSTGSACNSDSEEVSAVLRAMNVTYRAARGSIRFSLGRYNTAEEIDNTLTELGRVINQLSP